MRKGEITLGKWHFKLGFMKVMWRDDYFMFHFGIFKLLHYPPEGGEFTKEHYKGFWIRKYWSGFDVGFYLS